MNLTTATTLAALALIAPATAGAVPRPTPHLGPTPDAVWFPHHLNMASGAGHVRRHHRHYIGCAGRGTLVYHPHHPTLVPGPAPAPAPEPSVPPQGPSPVAAPAPAPEPTS